ncbi:hypothetical protein Hypma_007373, partial [Hypsizygus marmoreus]
SSTNPDGRQTTAHSKQRRQRARRYRSIRSPKRRQGRIYQHY